MSLSAALLLVAAPNVEAMAPSASSAIEDFASATTACLEATQTEAADEHAIEARNWTRSLRQPELVDRVSSFRREGSGVLLDVLKLEKQCSVMWLVQSPGDNAALIETVIDTVYDDAKDAFRQAKRTAAEANGKQVAVRFDVARTWATITAEDQGSSVLFHFGAMNKDNLEQAQRAQTSTPSQQSEQSRAE